MGTQRRLLPGEVSWDAEVCGEMKGIAELVADILLLGLCPSLGFCVFLCY